MIYGHINHWQLYFSPEFSVIIDAVNKHAQIGELGEFPINDWSFAKVMTYPTRTSEHGIESHRKWVDFQAVIHGKEQIDLFAPQDLAVLRSYQDDDDCIFYKNESVPCRSSVKLMSGMFGLFLPDDVHKTQIAIGQTEEIFKIVIKINHEFFTRRK